MALPLGIFLGGCVVAIPVVTGIAQGVEHQKKQNEEAANESRMWKFNCLVSCDDPDEIAQEEVNNGILVVRHEKVWVVPRAADNRPIPPGQALGTKGVEINPELGPLHAFAGFYIQYPDENRCPPERGLVSTISDDPPMLNWIYCDRKTYELRHANRTGSIEHHVGDWDWTEDETHLMFEGWEGFVVIDEWDGADADPSTPWGREGLRWAVYFDRDDNGLKGRRKGRNMFEISLKRRIQSAEEQLKQNEAAEKKMQVKSRGGLSTQFSAPTKERSKDWEKKYGDEARLALEKKLAKEKAEGQGPSW
ncbi:Nn.00g010490.m01.CDS01 [Neocucurbitaria sp. VM-36]